MLNGGQVLREICFSFLKLGLTAFGGPAAHTALMENQFVVQKKWLTRKEFLDLLGATHLIPGPNSTQMAMHLGNKRGGIAGLILAGVSFILPAMLIVWMIAWGYVRWGTLPSVSSVLYGLKPIIIAIVLQALWNLGRTAVRTKTLAVIGLTACAGALVGLNPLSLLMGGGLFHALSFRLKRNGVILPFLISLFLMDSAVAETIADPESVPVSLSRLFFFFIKIGSILFGSGYVLLAFLRTQLVEQWHWITSEQLLDAIAVGQFTPGPVFTTATFIGYVIAGNQGAAVSTLGIFLPSFFLVGISGWMVPKLRRSVFAGAFLEGVTCVSLALMAAVAFELTRVSLVDWLTIAIALGSTFSLIRYRVNSLWLLLVGGWIGFLTH